MRPLLIILLALLLAAPASAAITGEITSRGPGYAVARIGGTPYDMGYTHGALFAPEVSQYATWLRAKLGSAYPRTAAAMAATHWPFALQEQIRGMVDGVHAAVPSSGVTADDIRVLNTMSDWGYAPACRSTAAWGSFVRPGVNTLSIRRLDFPTPPGMTPLHLFVMYNPSWGHPYASLAEPGVLICGGTCVRDDGTMISLHDAPTSKGVRTAGTPKITRSVATYVALESGDVATAHAALQPYYPWTGSFVNMYVPYGGAGVLTANKTTKWTVRVPQPAWFGGEAIATSNTFMDGTHTPSDWSAVGTYYAGTRPKTLDSHWKLLNSIGTSAGFHMLAVEFRGYGNMTIRWRGRLVGAMTPTFQAEWSSLLGE